MPESADGSGRRHRRSRRPRRCGVLLLAAAVWALIAPGCIIANARTLETYGVPIGAATLERVPPGPGGADWLLAVLGPPETRVGDPGEGEGIEQWFWTGGVREHEVTGLLILRLEEHREREVVTEASVQDGTVLSIVQRSTGTRDLDASDSAETGVIALGVDREHRSDGGDSTSVALRVGGSD